MKPKNIINKPIAKPPAKIPSGAPGKVADTFAPATTRKGAEKFAVDTGLAQDVSYAGTDLNTANLINKTLTELRKPGDPLFNRIRPTSSKGSLFFVESSRRASDKSLTAIDFAFSRVNAKSEAAVREFMVLMNKQKLIKGKVPTKDLITHEYGHFLDQSKSAFSHQNSNRLNNLIKDEFFRETKTIAAAKGRLFKKVGDYVGASNGEQFAELYRLHKAKQLPREWKFVSKFFKDLEKAPNSARDKIFNFKEA